MNSPFVIAEMACAHDGSMENASVIVEGAIQSKANAVQFQIWKPTECVVPDHPDFELLNRIDLGYENWKQLILETRNKRPGLEIIACVYGVESAKFAAENGVSIFKIHTSDLSNPVLLQTCAKLAKRIDLSVGGSYDDEIESAIHMIKSSSKDCEIWLMYGIQLFPTPIEDINLHRMKYLADKFGCRVGFQDHSDPESLEAYSIPATALASGVNILEKHITHDRSKKGVDSQAALNPGEFSKFVQAMQNVFACVSQQGTELTAGEEKYRQYSKKQILASRDLSRGHVISADDMNFSRPSEFLEQGFRPDESMELIGKSLSEDIGIHSPFTRTSIES